MYKCYSDACMCAFKAVENISTLSEQKRNTLTHRLTALNFIGLLTTMRIYPFSTQIRFEHSGVNLLKFTNVHCAQYNIFIPIAYRSCIDPFSYICMYVIFTARTCFDAYKQHQGFDRMITDDFFFSFSRIRSTTLAYAFVEHGKMLQVQIQKCLLFGRTICVMEHFFVMFCLACSIECTHKLYVPVFLPPQTIQLFFFSIYIFMWDI